MADGQIRFAAFIGTKDEGEVLKRLIDHLRRIGIWRIVVIDHGSTDGTLEYLEAEEAAGDLWLLHRPEDLPRGVLRHAQVALAQASEADWVLLLDADEFPLPRSGSLHHLADLQAGDVLSVMRYNVVVGPSGPLLPSDISPATYGELLLFAQPIPDFYRYSQKHPETPWIRGVLEPKVLVRPAAISDLQPGSHDVETNDRRWRRTVATDLLIAHLPFSTLERFRSRSANYQRAIAASPDWFTDYQGWQWVRFAEAASGDRLDEEFARQVVSAEELAELRADHVVRSVADIFAQPVPPVTSEAGYLSMAMRAEPWLWMAGQVCRRERIRPLGKLERIASGGRFPTISIPPSRVVRFFGPWAGGRETCEREAAALGLMEADQSLPVPRLLARGEAEGGYDYLVMSRLPGSALRDVQADVKRASWVDLAEWLGRFVRGLQAVPVTDDERRASWDRFTDLVERRHAGARTIAADRGLPDHLVAQMERWLPSVAELAGSPGEAVLCHAGLDETSIVGWLDETRFVPLGIVDFGDAVVGHPLVDVGAVWWQVRRGEDDAFLMFLEAASVRGVADPGFQRLALAWSLLTPAREASDLEDVHAVKDLDELADRWFGMRVPSTAAGARPAGGLSHLVT